RGRSIASEDMTEGARDLDLPALPVQAVHGRMKRRLCLPGGRQRSRNDRRLEHALRLEDSGERCRERQLRSGQERGTLARIELERDEPRRFQSLLCRMNFSALQDLA